MSAFATTRWSLVMASCGEGADAKVALADLCQAYRAPILAFVRHHGHARQDAEDLVQAFFLALIEHRYQSRADAARGSFRTFLLVALRRFLAKARAHQHAAKRGGDQAHVAIEDGLDSPELRSNEAPEAAFDRHWALTVLNRALAKLEHEAREAGKGALFDRLKGHIADAAERHEYDDDARALGVAPNSVAVAVHRLRKRLRELVSEELSETVSNPEELSAELAALRSALGAA